MPRTQLPPEESLSKARRRALAESVKVWPLESGVTPRYSVTSASSDSAYEIVVHSGKITCTCRGYINWGLCKHVGAILNSLDLEAQTKRRYLALDIETASGPPEKDENWGPLGITCAATLTGDNGELCHWYTAKNNGLAEDEMSYEDVIHLLKYLGKMVENGYTILTWNGLKFDFHVLAEETGRLEECRTLALGRHIDMMFQVVCLRGHRLALDVAAKGMGLPGKFEGIDGNQAALLWAMGERRRRAPVSLDRNLGRTSAALPEAPQHPLVMERELFHRR